MFNLILGTLLIHLASAVILYDSETQTGDVRSNWFAYELKETKPQHSLIFTVAYSDSSLEATSIFVGINSNPQEVGGPLSSMMYSGVNSVVLPEEEVIPATYQIKVKIYPEKDGKTFFITAAYRPRTNLTDSQFVSGQLDLWHVADYFLPLEVPNQRFGILALSKSRTLEVKGRANGPPRSLGTTCFSQCPSSGYFFDSTTLTQNTEFYRLTVAALAETSFTLLGVLSHPDATELFIGETRFDVGDSSEASYYFYITGENDFNIEFTSLCSSANLYVAAGRVASVSDYDFKLETVRSKETLVLTSEDRQPLTGQYFVTVVPASFSVYSMFLTAEAVPIENGVPVHASIQNTLHLYEFLDEEGEEHSVKLYLGPSPQSAHLYFKKCLGSCLFSSEELQQPETYQVLYTQTTGGLASLEFSVPSEECKGPKPCIFLVGIRSTEKTQEEYILTVVNSDDTAISLIDHASLIMTVEQEEGKLFKYEVKEDCGIAVTLTASLLEGACTAYISRMQTPSADEYEKAIALTLDTHLEFIKGIDGSSLRGIYRMLIVGQCSVSVSAFTTLPNADFISALGQRANQVFQLAGEDTHRLFSFHIDGTTDMAPNVTITLAQKSGGFHLYVATDLEDYDASSGTMDFQWALEDFSSEQTRTLSLLSSTPHYKYPGTYLIGVFLSNSPRNQLPEFSIEYSSVRPIVPLTLGVSYDEEITPGESRYYSVALTKRNVSVMFTVVSGEAELFVAFNEQHPSKDSFLKKSQGGMSAEVIVTVEEQTQYCEDARTCSLYISVYSNEDSRYSIQIQELQPSLTELELNEELWNSLSETQNQTFYVNYQAESLAQLVISVTSGTVRIITEVSPVFGPDEKLLEEFPSVTNGFTWGFLTGPSSSRLYITVVCTMENCEFSLAPYWNELESLREDEVVSQTTEATTVYFQYNCTVAHPDLRMRVESSAALRLSVAKIWTDSWSFSGIDNFDWSSDTGAVLVSQFDSLFYSHSQNLEGLYIVAISGTSTARYSLSVHRTSESVVKVSQQTPILTQLQPGQAEYFIVEQEEAADLSLLWTQGHGSAEVFIGTLRSLDVSTLYANLPSKLSHNWKLKLSTESTEYIIKKADKHFCANCVYVIGVFADADEGWTSTVYVDSGRFITELHTGEVSNGNGSAGETKYYQYNLTEAIMTRVTVVSDVPVTLEVTSSADEYAPAIWSATDDSIQVVLDPSDDGFQVGVYSIRVILADECSFMLKVSKASSTQFLQDGVRVTAQLATDPIIYEAASASGVETYCNLVSSNLLPTVFLSFNASEQTPPGPGNAVHSYNASHYSSNKLTFSVNTTGFFFIGVYGSVQFEETEFTIDCTDGVQTIQHPLGEFKYYEFVPSVRQTKFEVIAEQPGTLVVYAEPCTALYEVAISSDWNFKHASSAEGKPRGRLRTVYPLTVPSTIYIQTTLVSSFNTSLNSFSLRAVVYNANRWANSELQSASNHSISMKPLKQADSLHLSWEPIKYMNGTEIEDTVVYKIYATKELNALFSTECSIEESTLAQKPVRSMQNSTQLTLEEDGEYLINVVGYSQNGESVPYSPLKITWKNPRAASSWQGWLLIAVLTAAFIGGVGFGVYLWTRKSRFLPNTPSSQLPPLVPPSNTYSLNNIGL